MDPAAFIAKWTPSEGSERGNKDHFLLELCDVLGVARPTPATNDPKKDLYVFEKPIPMVDEDGKTTVKRADLYKHGCFLLEAKQAAAQGSKAKGKTKRGTQSWDVAMYDARGQALGYVDALDDPPPFIIVCDIGYALELYADFDGSSRWHPFPNAQKKRIYLKDLAAHVDTLRAVFTDPHSLNPARHAEKVTREVAASLAELAKKLEAEKHAPEAVAKFLMRCLFTMFAEDVGLLPKNLLSQAIETEWIPHPHKFPSGIENLWQAMNEGRHFGFVGKLLRFNGGLFAQPEALRLGRDALSLLLDASKKDWSDVEPAIFGTLLERALNPKERHKLGAHYTPRAYVERLVRPTIEEPLREEWENVQTAARKLYQDGKEKDARGAVHAFHQKLCKTRVLDPACGSGNFLYVTLDVFKRLESEVLALLHDMGERQELLHAEGIRVTPGQFLGIEVKPWAKEIAELVLWIGYLQWHYRTHGRVTPPPEPVLQDFRNIECRDAVLAWDREELVRDAKGKPVTRWDGVTMKKHPVTGEEVPDEKATVPIFQYVNPRKAEWPEAEFVVGNPPFVANRNMRALVGDGYVEALHIAYPEIQDPVDLVMYFWWHAAGLASTRRIRRAGLITTNSIRMIQNQGVVVSATHAGAKLLFAIPDHPWPDDSSSAEVRISMTVFGHLEDSGIPRLVLTPTHDRVARGRDKQVEITESDLRILFRSSIPSDLSEHCDVSSLRDLKAGDGICHAGLKPYARTLVITAAEARQLIPDEALRARYAPPYRNGQDIGQRPRGAHVLDLYGLSEAELRARLPHVYQHTVTKTKPERATERNTRLRDEWWLFEANRPELRSAIRSLPRYIVTVESSPVRAFVFVDRGTLPDQKLRVIASDDAFVLGVLSSRIHAVFARRVGGRQGVRNTPVYNTRCFTRFPFPDVRRDLLLRIRTISESLSNHRRQILAGNDKLGLTDMYNVLDKLRSGEQLTDKERVIHDRGLVSVLKQLHDDLDAAVFEAYGWPSSLTDDQILEKLVALNAERAAEEERGLVKWLRPEFQNPEGARTAAQTEMAGMAESSEEEEEAPITPSAKAWPKKLAEQICAVREQIGARRGFFTGQDIARGFKGAKRKDVEELLEGLAALGVVVAGDGGRWRRAGGASKGRAKA